MSSLDELILFNSAFWREEGMLDGTKYAYMKKLAEHCRRAAGANFPAGYYEPESMPYMLALRDACAPSVLLAGARGRMYAFDIMERVPETTPLWHPSISDCRAANGIWSSPICSNIRARSGSSLR